MTLFLAPGRVMLDWSPGAGNPQWGAQHPLHGTWWWVTHVGQQTCELHTVTWDTELRMVGLDLVLAPALNPT